MANKIELIVDKNSGMIINAGTLVDGNLTVHGPVTIFGTLKGELTNTGLLTITTTGLIEGNVRTREAKIAGNINGNLTATKFIDLQPGATVNGDLYSGKINLAEGSTFNGKCTMIKQNDLVVDPTTKEVKLVTLSPEQILTQGAS